VSDPKTLLEVCDVRASIGSYQILHGVSFDVREGTTTVILGRNGVGKTTTLRTIMGFVEQTDGSIAFRGDRILGLQPYAIARRGIGYVPEHRGIFKALTVGENLRLASPDESDWEIGMDLFPELRGRLDDDAGGLSGGQQQMLTVARALAQRPELLLLDEPTQGLAPLVIDEMVEALKHLSGRTTILLVEQNLDVARRLADDAVVVDDGRTVASGKVAALEGAGDIERYLTVSMAGTAGRG